MEFCNKIFFYWPKGFQAAVLSVLAVAMQFSPCLGQVTQITGTVTAEFFSKEGESISLDERKFQLSVEESQFLLRVEKPGYSMATDYIEIASDGSSSYMLEAMPSWVSEQESLGNPVGDNIAIGTVTMNPVPQFPSVMVSGVLWCAYVAPSYLVNFESGATIYSPFTEGVKSNGVPVMSNDFFEMYSEWNYHGESRQLEDITFFGSDQSITNTYYSVHDWVMYDSEELPERASAITYARENSGVTKKQIEYTVELDTYSKEPGSLIARPSVPGLTYATEGRFATKEARDVQFSFSMTNRWPSIEESMLSDGYQNLVATGLGAPLLERHKFSNLYIIVILLIVLLVPAVIWLRAIKKNVNIS